LGNLSGFLVLHTMGSSSQGVEASNWLLHVKNWMRLEAKC
jgi:hypothetical protein